MSFLSDLKVCQHFYQRAEREGPVMFDIHPTLACQNKCYFCISANIHIAGKEHTNFSRAHMLDWNVLQRAAIDMKSMGVKSVQLTGGGEPSVYPQFGELLSILKPMKVGLITNGIVLSQYAREVKLFTNWVRFSLDASNRQMYRQIKGADHFDEVMESITVIADGKPGPRVGVAYIITPESVKGVEDIILELKGLPIDYLQFKDVVQRGMRLTDEYHAKVDKAIAGMRREVKFPILYTKHGDGASHVSKVCSALDYVAVLGADGHIYGCCHLEYMPEASYGSIYDKSLREIWAGKPVIDINEDNCWNCRFTQMNQVIDGLSRIEDGDFL